MIHIMRRIAANFCIMKTSNLVIGIDLGTTNSCVALMENKMPKVIPNSEGAMTTPSIVAFSKTGEKFVGGAAKRQSITNSQNTIFATKRLIGKRYEDNDVQELKKHFPYKIVRGSSGQASVQSFGQQYTPAQIGAFVLSKMKETAESYLNETVDKAVITVPAYFNDSQRQATKDAGRIAGLDVLRIINEPTAAALAYGMDRKEDKIIAVYDLGGGTFDISILEIGKNIIEVKATNGDTACGGEDVDGIVQQYLLEQFKIMSGLDVSKDRTALQRLREAAQKAKIELSHVLQTEVNLPFLATDKSGPKHFICKLTRHKLEQELSLAFLKRTIPPCQACIKDSGIDRHKIEEVILVGGMTRMPKVQEIVKSVFGKTPSKAVNPDEAVAIGAAIQGSILEGSLKDVVLLDVTPLSLSTEVSGGIAFKMIPRNTPIPVSKSNEFTTIEDRQTQVSLKILQGERHMAADNKLLGEFVLDGIPPAPKGQPKIQVTFTIDANGILHVTALDKYTNKKQSISINNSGKIPEKDIQRMIKDAEKYKKDDAKRQKISKIKSDIQNVYLDSTKQFNEFKDRLPAEIKQNIEQSLKKIESWQDKQIKTQEECAEAEKIIEETKKAIMQIGSNLKQ